MTTKNGILKNLSGYISVPELSKTRGVTRACIYRWLKRGLSHKRDQCGRIFVKREDAERFKPKSVGVPSTRTKDQLKTAKRLRGEGKSYSQIAETLGVSIMTAWNWINKKEATPCENKE